MMSHTRIREPLENPTVGIRKHESSKRDLNVVMKTVFSPQTL